MSVVIKTVSENHCLSEFTSTVVSRVWGSDSASAVGRLGEDLDGEIGIRDQERRIWCHAKSLWDRCCGVACTRAGNLGRDGRCPAGGGAAARAGEKLDEVGRKIRRGLEKAEDAVREGFHKTRDSVHSMGVISRVYGRLHWDKWLHSSTLTLKVEDGVVTLRGAVPSKAAKTKAVTLAAETVGVTKVIDELTIPVSEADEIPRTSKP